MIEKRDIGLIVLGLLISGNGYFIKRLVNQLDTTVEQVYLLRIEVSSLKQEIRDLDIVKSSISWKKSY